MTRASTALALALISPCALAQQPRRPARGITYTRRVMRFGDRSSTVHVARVDLCDASITLRATSPREAPRRVSVWAAGVGAALAVNGDYFDPRAYNPLGVARGDGVSWPTRATTHHDALLASDADGAVALLGGADDIASVPPRWREVVALREQVLARGELRESPDIHGRDARHPRTGLGLSADRRTLYLVVVEGRSARDGGVTARQLGGLLRSLGAYDGFKLDGGGSSTMFVRGRGVVNRPSDGGERVVATHLGVRAGAPRGAPRCR